MSNFLDLDDQAPQSQRPALTELKELISLVPVSQAPTRLHTEVSDTIAKKRGFTSREPTPSPTRVVGAKRQPRGLAAEETRQLSIRMPASLYAEFLEFADSRQLTYNEAIRYLLRKNEG